MTGSEWLTALSLVLNTFQVVWLATLRSHQKGAEAQLDDLTATVAATVEPLEADPRKAP